MAKKKNDNNETKWEVKTVNTEKTDVEKEIGFDMNMASESKDVPVKKRNTTTGNSKRKRKPIETDRSCESEGVGEVKPKSSMKMATKKDTEKLLNMMKNEFQEYTGPWEDNPQLLNFSDDLVIKNSLQIYISLVNTVLIRLKNKNIISFDLPYLDDNGNYIDIGSFEIPIKIIDNKFKNTNFLNILKNEILDEFDYLTSSGNLFENFYSTDDVKTKVRNRLINKIVRIDYTGTLFENSRNIASRDKKGRKSLNNLDVDRLNIRIISPILIEDVYEDEFVIEKIETYRTVMVAQEKKYLNMVENIKKRSDNFFIDSPNYFKGFNVSFPGYEHFSIRSDKEYYKLTKENPSFSIYITHEDNDYVELFNFFNECTKLIAENKYFGKDNDKSSINEIDSPLFNYLKAIFSDNKTILNNASLDYVVPEIILAHDNRESVGIRIIFNRNSITGLRFSKRFDSNRSKKYLPLTKEVDEEILYSIITRILTDAFESVGNTMYKISPKTFFSNKKEIFFSGTWTEDSIPEKRYKELVFQGFHKDIKDRDYELLQNLDFFCDDRILYLSPLRNAFITIAILATLYEIDILFEINDRTKYIAVYW